MGNGGDARGCNAAELGGGLPRGEERGKGDGEGWRGKQGMSRGVLLLCQESKAGHAIQENAAAPSPFVLLFRCGSVGRGNRELWLPRREREREREREDERGEDPAGKDDFASKQGDES
jgi:hypothetical protein